MKRSLLLFTLCAAMSMACSSSDALADPEGTAELLQDCSIAGALQLLATFDRLGDIVDEASGADQTNVTATPTGTANEFNVTATFDSNGDDVDDITLTGTALFSKDPGLGLVPGDTLTLALTQTGTVAGTLNLVATIGDGSVDLTGTANFTGLGGCNVSLTIPVATPLVIEGGELSRARQLAGFEIGNLIDFNVQGAFSGVISGSGATLSSDVAISGLTVSFTNVSINGIDLAPATVSLPSPGDLSGATSCMTNGFFTMDEMAEAVGNVAQAMLDAETTVDGDPFTATPVVGQANTFDVTISSQRTFTGRITFPGDPTAAELTGLATISSWQISTSSVEGGVNFDLSGNSTAVFGVNLDLNDDLSFYGSGVFTEGACMATVAVSPNAPYATRTPSTNRFTFNSAFGDVTIAADVVVIDELERFDIFFVNATINDLAVPTELLGRLADFLD